MESLVDTFDKDVDECEFDPRDEILELREADDVEWSLSAGVDRVARLREQQGRLLAQEQRELARLSSAVRLEGALLSGSDREIAHRSLVSELAAVARVSDRTMNAWVSAAGQLVSDFPATLAALESGSIGRGHVRLIVDCGTPILDADARARFEQIVLERAVDTTPGQLRSFARLTAARMADGTLQERHDRALAKRMVEMVELDDGMSQLIQTLPTAIVAGIWDRLTRQAKALSSAGDPRTFDQLRADLATELLLVADVDSHVQADADDVVQGSIANGDGTDGDCANDDGASCHGTSPHGSARGIDAEIVITIPVLTLLGVDDEPATIDGWGPIDLDTAKRFAAGADHWIRVLTHPVTGAVVATDTYRPSEKLKRLLWARDGRCRFPTCNQVARRCDIDHTVDWQFGGKTTIDNLACLCRGHHTLKHHGGWKVRQTAPGVLEWTSPLGRVVGRAPVTTSFVAA